jgi:hypothetical protein
MLQSKDPVEQKSALRSIIAHVDVERIDNMLKGTIYYYLPDDNDDEGPGHEDDPSPNTDLSDDYVPISHHPPGSQEKGSDT